MDENKCEKCKYFAEEWLMCDRLSCHVYKEDSCEHYEEE
jgi:hypothetical protein